MAEVRLNTLYVTTRGAYLRRDGQTLQVEIEKIVKLAVPIHHLESVALLGKQMVSPGAMALCAEAGVALAFLSESGRLLARVDAPGQGNVLLRREQYRRADSPEASARIAAEIVVGKLQNCRTLLMRSARESDDPGEEAALRQAADALSIRVRHVREAVAAGETDLDVVRGHEGLGARDYFAAFSRMLRQQREVFPMTGRTRRPPLDRPNAMLSFLYALLAHDCAAAAAATGLDPSVGYLHADRPGRPSLALDLMEEFRPLLVDRLVTTLINRQQVRPEGFIERTGGAIEMTEPTRKALIVAYQQRKQEEVMHPLLEQSVRIGQLPFLQARLLARHLRGDLPAYSPCILR